MTVPVALEVLAELRDVLPVVLERAVDRVDQPQPAFVVHQDVLEGEVAMHARARSRPRIIGHPKNEAPQPRQVDAICERAHLVEARRAQKGRRVAPRHVGHVEVVAALDVTVPQHLGHPHVTQRQRLQHHLPLLLPNQPLVFANRARDLAHEHLLAMLDDADHRSGVPTQQHVSIEGREGGVDDAHPPARVADTSTTSMPASRADVMPVAVSSKATHAVGSMPSASAPLR